jgi:hypothetical protein
MADLGFPIRSNREVVPSEVDVRNVIECPEAPGLVCPGDIAISIRVPCCAGIATALLPAGQGFALEAGPSSSLFVATLRACGVVNVPRAPSSGDADGSRTSLNCVGLTSADKNS